MAQTAQLRRIDVAENYAQRVFNLQRAAYARHPYPSYEERRQNLDKLERILVQNVDEIAEAINTDFGCRCPEESKLLASMLYCEPFMNEVLLYQVFPPVEWLA